MPDILVHHLHEWLGTFFSNPVNPSLKKNIKDWMLARKRLPSEASGICLSDKSPENDVTIHSGLSS